MIEHVIDDRLEKYLTKCKDSMIKLTRKHKNFWINIKTMLKPAAVAKGMS